MVPSETKPETRIVPLEQQPRCPASSTPACRAPQQSCDAPVPEKTGPRPARRHHRASGPLQAYGNHDSSPSPRFNAARAPSAMQRKFAPACPGLAPLLAVQRSEPRVKVRSSDEADAVRSRNCLFKGRLMRRRTGMGRRFFTASIAEPKAEHVNRMAAVFRPFQRFREHNPQGSGSAASSAHQARRHVKRLAPATYRGGRTSRPPASRA